MIDLYQSICNEDGFIDISVLHLSCGKVILNQQEDVGQSFAGALLCVGVSFHQVEDLLVLQVFKPLGLAITPWDRVVVLDELLHSRVRDSPHLLVLQALIRLSAIDRLRDSVEIHQD